MPKLQPPSINVGGKEHRIPERILLYGNEGVGKTQTYLDIAALLAQVGDDAQLHVADADAGAVLRSMSGEKYRDLANVNVTDISDFPDYPNWARTVSENCKPGDWAIVDTASSGYHKAQDYYIFTKYGMTRAELEFERILDTSRGNGPLIEPEDWIMIRSLFLNWWERHIITELSEKRGLNILATAEAKMVHEHFEKKSNDNSTLMDYGGLKFRPDGHKSLAHKVHTVAFLKRTGADASKAKHWFIPTKDRQRETKNLEITDFAVDYLMGRAGWVVE